MHEIYKIRQKFVNAEHLPWFINSVMKQFNDKLSEKSNEENDYILPPDFFAIKKHVIFLFIPHTARKTVFSKKIHELTNDL